MNIFLKFKNDKILYATLTIYKYIYVHEFTYVYTNTPQTGEE